MSDTTNKSIAHQQNKPEQKPKKFICPNFLKPEKKPELTPSSLPKCFVKEDFCEELAHKFWGQCGHIFISGERGSGRTYLAHFIGNKPGFFYQFNCSSLLKNVRKYAFFGHDFRNLDARTTPILFRANEKVLLLEEIDSLSLEEQGVLYSAMRENRLFSLKDGKYLKFSCKFIVTANNDLKDLVDKGLFREDLLNFLLSASFSMPTYKKRKEVISAIIKSTFEGFSHEHQNKVNFSEELTAFYTESLCSPEIILPYGFTDIKYSVLRMLSAATDEINKELVDSEIAYLKANYSPVLSKDVKGDDINEPDEHTVLTKLGLKVEDFSLLEAYEIFALYKSCYHSKNCTEAGRKLLNSTNSAKRDSNCNSKLNKMLDKYQLEYETLRDLHL